MKYGKLFNSFINAYDYKPSKNRCSSLTYSELKFMAKLMYYDVAEVCKREERDNPLNTYMRQTHLGLQMSVYRALRILFN